MIAIICQQIAIDRQQIAINHQQIAPDREMIAISRLQVARSCRQLRIFLSLFQTISEQARSLLTVRPAYPSSPGSPIAAS